MTLLDTALGAVACPAEPAAAFGPATVLPTAVY